MAGLSVFAQTYKCSALLSCVVVCDFAMVYWRTRIELIRRLLFPCGFYSCELKISIGFIGSDARVHTCMYCGLMGLENIVRRLIKGKHR